MVCVQAHYPSMGEDFSMKNPWSYVTALKPWWIRDKRGDPTANAATSTLNTPSDFQDILDARNERAEKRKAAKPKKVALAASTEGEGATYAGPSAAPKGKKKTSKR